MVIKRDGRKVAYDESKIRLALNKAAGEVSTWASGTMQTIERIVEYCNAKFADVDVSVEDIQDVIERKLMESSRKDIAKAYILYRQKRAEVRDIYKKWIDVYGEKLNAVNVVNQNANLDEKSFGGRKGQAADSIAKEWALNNCMCKKSKDLHLSNHIYIHDLDSYALGEHNCLSIPLDHLLANGFTTRNCDIRPAKSVSTALQLCAVIMQLQSLQQFGGVSYTHLDHSMVPYVRMSFVKHFKKGLRYINGIHNVDEYDYTDLSILDHRFKVFPHAYRYAMDMTKDEIYQSVEALYHNLNSLQSRSGNQLPFSSINFGTCTEEEGRMVSHAILRVLYKGVGPKGQTSIFPCVIFQYMKGINDEPGTINYDLFKKACGCTARRLYPNYANVDWSGNAGYDRSDPKTYFSTMGCRTANGWDVNGFGQLKDGRGNICPVTIILPTYAKEAYDKYPDNPYERVECFMELISSAIDDAKDMLIERFEYICSQDASSANFMWKNNTMAGYVPEEGIRSALKHGTLAIGQLGLAEALFMLVGCDHTTELGMDIAKNMEGIFKEKAAQFKKEYSLNFGVYYTPAESLCYTALKKFREQYGVITGVSDKDYFTNSIHVPVWHKLTPFEKIDIESQLTGYSSAGCITYVELDAEAEKNPEAVGMLVHYGMDKDLPYFAINVPNDVCRECGTVCNGCDACPECGSTNIKHLRRVTGYLTGDYEEAFNAGKQAEVHDRVKHDGYEVC